MFEFMLAAILAQMTPATDPSPEPSATANAAAPGVITLPRGPRRNPIEVPSMAADDIFIRNGGSTNTAGYAIVVHKNFMAEFAGQQKMVGEPQAKWLYLKVEAAKPFADLGASHCMKSASFGSVTTITYDGETTPDLSCPGGPDSRELLRTIRVIVTQLGISTAPGSRFQRM